MDQTFDVFASHTKRFLLDRSDQGRKDKDPVKVETVALVGQSGMEEAVRHLEAERVQLHRDLQRCLYEIQQRDHYFQQLNTKV